MINAFHGDYGKMLRIKKMFSGIDILIISY